MYTYQTIKIRQRVKIIKTLRVIGGHLDPSRNWINPIYILTYENFK